MQASSPAPSGSVPGGSPLPDSALSTLGTVLVAVRSYGLATVLTLLLLGYVLWSAYNAQSIIGPRLAEMADLQRQQVVLLGEQGRLLQLFIDRSR